MEFGSDEDRFLKVSVQIEWVSISSCGKGSFYQRYEERGRISVDNNELQAGLASYTQDQSSIFNLCELSLKFEFYKQSKELKKNVWKYIFLIIDQT